MRFLTILVTVLAVLYGGYWFVGSRAVERGATAALASLRDEGWRVDYASLATRGFPSRFDTTVTRPSVTEPVTGIGWQAPFIQVFALSYAPNRVIVVWPSTQQVILPDQTLTIDSEGLRGSAAVAPGTRLPLDEVTIEAGVTRIASDLGWQSGFDRALAAFRAVDDAAATYDMFAEASAVALPAALRAAFDPQRRMPPVLEVARLDAEVVLDRPIDGLASPQEAAPALEALSLRDLRLTWGNVRLRGEGEITVDRAGVPDGTLTFTVDGWREVIAMAVDAGLIDPGVAPTWENMGTALASASEDGALRVPLTFNNGFASVGPLPVGRAPRLR